MHQAGSAPRDFPSSSEDEVQVEPDDGHQELSPHGGPKDLGSTSSSKNVKKRVYHRVS